MASKVEIANLGLQKLGAKRISDFNDASPNARAVSAAWENVRRLALQSHPWVFATKRVILAASAVPGVFTHGTEYPLPADFLRLLPPDSRCGWPYDDKQIEGRSIFVESPGPLEIRYTADIEDVNLYSPLFIDALACMLALQLCEEITQSNAKKEGIKDDYKLSIREARRQNALENRARYPVIDTWEAVRR